MGRSAIDVPPAGTVRRGANRSANLCEARTVRKVRWEPEANAKDCFRSKQEPHMAARAYRSEEHTSELQSLMRISYAVFCLKKKNKLEHTHTTNIRTRKKIA